METNNKITIGCLSPIWIVVFLAFFWAKILGYINWSWWLVFTPIWAPVVFAIIIFIIIIGLKIWIKW
jgi:hypothetical protein